MSKQDNILYVVGIIILGLFLNYTLPMFLIPLESNAWPNTVTITAGQYDPFIMMSVTGYEEESNDGQKLLMPHTFNTKSLKSATKMSVFGKEYACIDLPERKGTSYSGNPFSWRLAEKQIAEGVRTPPIVIDFIVNSQTYHFEWADTTNGLSGSSKSTKGIGNPFTTITSPYIFDKANQIPVPLNSKTTTKKCTGCSVTGQSGCPACGTSTSMWECEWTVERDGQISYETKSKTSSPPPCPEQPIYYVDDASNAIYASDSSMSVFVDTSKYIACIDYNLLISTVTEPTDEGGAQPSPELPIPTPIPTSSPLFIIFSIIGLTFGGYFGYNYYQKTQKKRKRR